MPGGRPPKFETPEQLEAAIDKYFADCVPKPIFVTDENDGIVMVKDAKGNPVINENPPTTYGLALALGFVSRQSLYDQDDRGEAFSYPIKKALMKIGEHHESRLSGGMPTGSIFALKNQGWADKQDIGLTGANGGPIEFTEIKRVIVDPKA